MFVGNYDRGMYFGTRIVVRYVLIRSYRTITSPKAITPPQNRAGGSPIKPRLASGRSDREIDSSRSSFSAYSCYTTFLVKLTETIQPIDLIPDSWADGTSGCHRNEQLR